MRTSGLKRLVLFSGVAMSSALGFGLDWEAAGRFKVIDVFGMSKYEQRQASVTC